MTFNPGDSEDLRQKINMLLKDQNQIEKMGKKARIFVAAEFNAEKHYQGLMEIYDKTIAAAGGLPG